MMSEKILDEQTINKIVLEAGFVKAAVIDTSALQFNYEFRQFCEANDCGNYGKNYGCPPYCGTPEEMENKIMQYRKALVFQSRNQVKDVMDPAEIKPLKKGHIQGTRRAMKRLEEAGLKMDGFAIMCGPCNFCPTCAIQDGKPCPHEEVRASCLSAYCINATEMAHHCGMEIDWSGSMASFFSLYVFDKK